MSSQFKSFLTNIGALGLLVAALFFIAHLRGALPETELSASPSTQAASVGVHISPVTTATSSSVVNTPPTAAMSTVAKAAVPKQKAASSSKPTATQPAQQAVTGQVTRIQNPYPFPQKSFDDINVAARMSVVNILCAPQGGNFHSISGSGVIIDPRGVILTNAHVAQYVLLSENPKMGLHCVIRTGSPAVAHWNTTVLFIPPIWVNQHAVDISALHATGTGEHDYALLLVTSSLDGSPLPYPGVGFPSLTPDVREGITFLDDQILAASYPAEFLGGLAAQNDLYSASSITTVKQLLTFGTGTVDVLSLGGVIEAQSGSSGGGVLNAWAQLVGIITTTSEGATTADRDLRAVTLSYIDRDMRLQSGYSLTAILGGDVNAEALDFTTNAAPSLINLLISQIKG